MILFEAIKFANPTTFALYGLLRGTGTFNDCHSSIFLNRPKIYKYLDIDFNSWFDFDWYLLKACFEDSLKEFEYDKNSYLYSLLSNISSEELALKVKFDSYMIPTDSLTNKNFRLLSVDNEIRLPARTHVRLLVTSDDVLHSWAVPSLGIKVDACPGRLNQVSLYTKREGHFFGQCSEICGVNHAFMPIHVYVEPGVTFSKWLTKSTLGISII